MLCVSLCVPLFSNEQSSEQHALPSITHQSGNFLASLDNDHQSHGCVIQDYQVVAKEDTLCQQPQVEVHLLEPVSELQKLQIQSNEDTAPTLRQNVRQRGPLRILILGPEDLFSGTSPNPDGKQSN